MSIIEINQELEITPTDSLAELVDEVQVYSVAKSIEKVLETKVNRNEALTDEEIYISVETIGRLYSQLPNSNFTTFGFESYEGKSLTQEQKSKVALEAITNQNADKASTIKAKIENFNSGLTDYFSWFTGNLNKIRSDAEDLLNRVRSADESDFRKETVTDRRVFPAVNRGYKERPFRTHKETINALRSFNDSIYILANARNYETLAGRDGGKWDLSKLMKDMKGRVVNRANGKVTYELNPEKINAKNLLITIPEDSQSNYVMRNIKANFVVNTTVSDFDANLSGGQGEVNLPALSRKECIDLLQNVISFIDEENASFRKYYRETKVGFTDLVKLIPKYILTVGVAYFNSMIFMSKIQLIATHIHYTNAAVTRGLLAWVASSMR